jgi:two-component system, cell cycle sensor histidine kinase and response regulator CckA
MPGVLITLFFHFGAHLRLSPDKQENITLTPHLTIRKNRTMDAVKAMASALSHDFNSILTTISYSIELALDDIPENSLTYEDLERVLQTSLEAGEYIRDILSFCKPSKTGFENVDIHALTHGVVDTLRRRIPEQIAFHEDLPEESPTVRADPDQLTEIIEQLMDNAVQSLGSSPGRIDLSLSYSHMPGDEKSHEPCILFRISDNGSGILESDMPLIFDPFFTTKQKNAHKGLGLSKVFSLVENHNGLLQVTSIPREKTTFDVYLPVLI